MLVGITIPSVPLEIKRLIAYGGAWESFVFNKSSDVMLMRIMVSILMVRSGHHEGLNCTRLWIGCSESRGHYPEDEGSTGTSVLSCLSSLGTKINSALST